MDKLLITGVILNPCGQKELDLPEPIPADTPLDNTKALGLGVRPDFPGKYIEIFKDTCWDHEQTET